MDDICGFFDTQGFRMNKVYHPKEIACLSDSEIICLKVSVDVDEPDYPFPLADVTYLTQNHHGLELNSPDDLHISREAFGSILKEFHDVVKSPNKNIIAVKSREAEEILNEFNIPTINILSIGCTHKAIKDIDRLPCSHHIIQAPFIKCSLNTVLMMKKWVQSLTV